MPATRKMWFDVYKSSINKFLPFQNSKKAYIVLQSDFDSAYYLKAHFINVFFFDSVSLTEQSEALIESPGLQSRMTVPHGLPPDQTRWTK